MYFLLLTYQFDLIFLLKTLNYLNPETKIEMH